MAEATDPANQFAYEGFKAPRVDWAEKARLDAQEAYYKQHDSEQTKVNRNGHIWGVRKR